MFLMLASGSTNFSKAKLYEFLRTNLSTFYAKQTQSQVGQNQPKLFNDKYIRVLGHLVIGKKQSQTNPIKAKTNPIQTQLL